MRHPILIILLFLLVTSCSFNRMFYHPVQLSSKTNEVTFPNSTDTIVVYFSGEDHSPTVTKNGKDTIDMGFTIESVLFESTDGNILNGWFLKPKDTKPTVTLLHLHGNSGFIPALVPSISPLVKEGFQIFMFDYSGFGFSEGKATRNHVLADAVSALDYLKTRPEVKNTKLVIYGQSLGGHLAAVVAARCQDDIDGLVVEGAFSSHRDIAVDRAGFIARILVKQGYNATKSISQYHKPLLVIHSTEDKTVPFYMGQKIYDHANPPKEFYEIENCHICGPRFYPEEIAGKIRKMLGSE
jgi:dipeptidyl aminopeptidase/acylaminoacyl peptidase